MLDTLFSSLDEMRTHVLLAYSTSITVVVAYLSYTSSRLYYMLKRWHNLKKQKQS